MSTLRVLRIPVDGTPELLTLDRRHEVLAAAIGAEWIERVRTPIEDVVLIVDEEGRVTGRPNNPVSFQLYPDIIAGDVLISGEDDSWEGRDWSSLTDEQLRTVVRHLGIDLLKVVR